MVSVDAIDGGAYGYAVPRPTS